MLDILSRQPRCVNLVPIDFIVLIGALVLPPMSGKRQKLPTKRGRASEDPTANFDVTRFVNEGVADRFGTICKNRSFIKEKGFHHPDDFFRKTIAAKGWRALCQPPHPVVMSVVREFYTNLASHVIKKVRVWGVLVDFSAKLINHFYNLDHVPSEPFDGLYERPDYPDVTPRLPVRYDWQIRTEFGVRDSRLGLFTWFFLNRTCTCGYGQHL